MANTQTYERLTPREQLIARDMRAMLEFIRKGDALTTPEARLGHTHQVVGWATGTAKSVLDLLGEKP